MNLPEMNLYHDDGCTRKLVGAFDEPMNRNASQIRRLESEKPFFRFSSKEVVVWKAEIEDVESRQIVHFRFVVARSRRNLRRSRRHEVADLVILVSKILDLGILIE